MKRLLLFFLLWYGGLQAQITVSNLAPYEVCDTDTDGFSNFNLSFQIPLILNATSPANNPNNAYEVSFYETVFDAQQGVNPMVNLYYQNIIPVTQNIYFRVSNAIGEYVVGTQQLRVNLAPYVNPNVTPLSVVQSSGSGITAVDLTSKDNEITFGISNTLVYYFTGWEDAMNNANPIANPTSFINTVPYHQTIWAREVNAASGCFSITSFQLVVNALTLQVPTPYVLCDTNNDQVEAFNLNTKEAEILGNISPVGLDVWYFPTYADAINFTNILVNNIHFGNSTTVVARFLDSQQRLSFQEIKLKLNPNPVVTITGQNTACIGEQAFLTVSASNVSPTVIFDYSINGSPATATTTQLNYFIIPVPTNAAGPFTVAVSNAASTNDGSYCSSPQTASVTVMVGSLPNAMMNVSATAACVNSQNVQLTIVGTSGTPPFSFTYDINGITSTVSSTPGTMMAIVPFPTTVAGTYVVNLLSVASGSCVNQLSNSPSVITIENGVVANDVPELTVTDTPFNGVASFDLTAQSAGIIGNQANCTVQYYLTQANASNQVNPIANPTSFTNTSNPQTIYARIFSNGANVCVPINSFSIRVLDPSVIYIPDANFKAQLVAANPNNQIAMNGSSFITIDVNHDGEIQYAEALLVQRLLVIQANIVSMEGVQHFTNLTSLACHLNQINYLPLNGLVHLQELHCQNNALTSLTVTGLTSLQTLDCADNQLQYLEASNIALLNLIKASNNVIMGLELHFLPSLQSLYLANNQLSSCELHMMNSLHVLDLTNNLLTSFDASLYSQTNNLLGLTELYLGQNQLTSVELGDNLHDLTTLNVQNNNINSIIITGLPALTTLNISSNPMGMLDAAANTQLVNLSFAHTNLVWMFLKNGSNENISFVDVIGTPTLQYICVDQAQVTSMQNLLNTINNNQIVLNSYCTITPGGNFNTVSGWVRYDYNGNGCDANDDMQPLIRMALSPALPTTTSTAIGFTNTASTYSFYTGAGDYTVSPYLENSTWFVANPTSSAVHFDDTLSNAATRNFCLTPNGYHPDVEIVIAPMWLPHPGFETWYRLVIKNKGNQTGSGTVSLNYNSAMVNFLTASLAPTFNSTGQLRWTYSGLQPFENREIDLIFQVHSPQEAQAVNIGDLLVFTAAIVNSGPDDTPADNQWTQQNVVVGSFDPNNVICLEGSSLDPIYVGDYLHYVINFENTGTAPTSFITVSTEFDPIEFDVNSIQVLNTSHPAVTRVVDNRLEVFFPTINLDSGGHGNVLLKVRSNNGLGNGDAVQRRAGIYFDYNFPVITNLAVTTYETLDRNLVTRDESIVLSPNPTKGIIQLNAQSDLLSYTLYDGQGRQLQTETLSGLSTTANMSGQPTGLYFVKVTSSTGSKVFKVIKE